MAYGVKCRYAACLGRRHGVEPAWHSLPFFTTMLQQMDTKITVDTEPCVNAVH